MMGLGAALEHEQQVVSLRFCFVKRWIAGSSPAMTFMFETTAMGFAKRSTHLTLRCLTGKSSGQLSPLVSSPFEKIF
jgi:hypothetical protein